MYVRVRARSCTYGENDVQSAIQIEIEWSDGWMLQVELKRGDRSKLNGRRVRASANVRGKTETMIKQREKKSVYVCVNVEEKHK